MPATVKPGFLYRNSLSIVVLVCMLILWAGQFYTGWKVHNEERAHFNSPPLSVMDYAGSGHFASATFENWESEFLQMALYVILTISLRQRGSAESKKLKDEEGAGDEPVDRQPVPSAGAPWPVRKGGIWLKVYSNSLSLVLTLLFLLTFFLHFRGSLAETNEEHIHRGEPLVSAWNYLGDKQLWFESFQNWQSEFLSVATIVLLTIWLRQKGSPESKPVDAPHSETGK